jgi:Arc/MetJ-type ribon-helix-helix transcriptional regulator
MMEGGGCRKVLFLFSSVVDEGEAGYTSAKLGICPMEATRRLEIELPEELAESVSAQVASGRFSSESEAVASALILQREQDEDELEDWVREEIAAAYDEWKTNPGAVHTAEEIRAHLEERRRQRG